MKRIFFLIALLLLVRVDTVHAQTVITNNATADSEKSGRLQTSSAVSEKSKGNVALPFKIGNPLGRVIQNITGITPISQFILDQTVQAILRHQLGGKVKVKIRLWSLTDLLAGKIRGANLRLAGSSYKGVPMGIMEAQVNEPVQLTFLASGKKRRRLRFDAPLLVTLKVKVKEEDLAVALANAKVASSLKALKLDLPGLGQQELEILSPKVKLDNDLVTVAGVLVTKGGSPDTGVPLKISGNLKLKGDESIVLANTVVDAKTLVDPEHFASFLEDLLNPIVSLHKFDRATRALRLDNLAIARGFVAAEGRVILVP